MTKPLRLFIGHWSLVVCWSLELGHCDFCSNHVPLPGLLLSYPVRELFMRVARARGFWSYYLPLDVTISLSGLTWSCGRVCKQTKKPDTWHGVGLLLCVLVRG